MSRRPAGLGARYLGDGRSEFVVWAPRAESLDLEIVEPDPRIVPLMPQGDGYYRDVVAGVEPGTLYRFRLDGATTRPDPASRRQPRGVHGPSAVVDPAFDWSDDGWSGPPLERTVLYEIHVGTFTPRGTFDAVVPRLDALADLGVTTIELMPVAQFPGRRNWGYDGVYPFAAQDSYGGFDGLRRLVDAAHARGLAVVLDVVYNHLGPEGNYLADFGPYFTDRFRTPWGDALNFDGACSDHVRRFFIENARWWIEDGHVDGLRLDAVHGILDTSAVTFLEELGTEVHRAGDRVERRVLVIPESDLNDPRLVTDVERGGYGLDAVWTDDFHHALHALLTGERQGYYGDFGGIEELEWAFCEGFVYAGQHSGFRGRRHGRSARSLPAWRHVVCSQNHDQVGNRAASERLSALVDDESLKLAAATVLLSPYVPLLFMGEEYGETAPFPYFVDHADEDLVEAVREGRAAEFEGFDWEGEIPDPAAEETFAAARLDWSAREAGRGARLLGWYRALLAARREVPALAHLDKEDMHLEDSSADELLVLRRWPAEGDSADCFRGRPVTRPGEVAIVLHFGAESRTLDVPLPEGRWETALDSAAGEWGGPGSRLPESLESDGSTVALALGARSAVLLRLADA